MTMEKNKKCYDSYDFQNQMNKLTREIGGLQEAIEEHGREMDSKRKEILELKQRIKTMALKGDCDKCEHKLECLTTNKEGIDVKVGTGW